MPLERLAGEREDEARKDMTVTAGNPDTTASEKVGTHASISPYFSLLSNSNCCFLFNLTEQFDTSVPSIENWAPELSMRQVFSHVCPNANFETDREMFSSYTTLQQTESKSKVS